ncbi:MAG TPA: photosynthetic complex assembly protein PuhC [Sandaracinaceae bacterium LLY-WYZ-13_1]|nr:photosynthetic complex assembly protein PuhC [Sandaracinaceae bacterium LLY-WYZ-13_1]
MAHHHDTKVPRGVLLGAGAMMLFTIAIAAFARSERMAAEDVEASPRISVELRFEDRPDGSVAALDPATDREVHVVAPESGGFVRGVLRGVFRTRHLESMSRHEPLRLTRDADGRLELFDPQSGHRVELRSFGHTNYESFAQILEAARRRDS